MKKLFSLMGIVVFVILLWTPVGVGSSEKLKILNMELPPEIKGGDKIPIKIIYEEGSSGSSVESIYIRTTTSRGNTNHILKEASRFSKSNGVIEIFMSTLKGGGVSIGTDILISISLKDGEGNKSNTISKWVTIK